MMKDVTLYLDMDGVVADFNKKFHSMESSKEDHLKFRDAVMIHKIFEDLDLMPDALELLNHVRRIASSGVNVEMLTSVGTFDNDRGQAAKDQKLHWLAKHNIPYKANFVRAKPEKAKYANDHSILVDDSVGCISPFVERGGHGILHTNSSETNRLLDSIILQIRALDALRS